MGLKPAEGEIMDIFPLTIRSYLRRTVADPGNTPEFAKIYGGDMSPEQFELFDRAFVLHRVNRPSGFDERGPSGIQMRRTKGIRCLIPRCGPSFDGDEHRS